MTKIEWTNRVWNPVTGCTKVSEACEHCYAEVMANRLSGMPQTKEKYRNRFGITYHEEDLMKPYDWKSGMVFVCSMGDLFHSGVSFEFIEEVMDVIEHNPQCTFQILTKRASRMYEYFKKHKVPSNAWVGVTCENAKRSNRIDILKKIDASVRFVSCEPLLGDMGSVDLSGIQWVITGGESGAKARPTKVEWFRTLRDVCLGAHIPFFFKQWGAWGEDGIKRSKYKNSHTLDGVEYHQLPNL